MRGTLFLIMIAAASASALGPHFPFGLADYDWAFHICTFLFLTLVGIGFGWSIRTTATLISLIGAAIEMGQIFIPTRSATLRDIGLNFVGIALGIAVVIAWRNWRSILVGVK